MMKRKARGAFIIVVCLCTKYAFSQTYRALQQIKELREKRVCECMHESYLFSLYHYPKFFSDKNTIYGKFADRSFLLTGTNTGWRSTLADNGVYLDASVYQFLGTNFTGGAANGDVRYNGNAEYWLLFDFGQMDFWSKGAFLVRGESAWKVNDSINDDVGSLLDSNVRSTKTSSRLAEFMLAQFLTDSFVFRLGKVDITGPFEATDFAKNSRFQFIYAGLTNNPIISSFTKDVPMGFMPTWIPSKHHNIMFFLGDAKKCSNESSFEPLFNGNVTMLLQYTLSLTFGDGYYGNFRVVYPYTRRSITNYAINQKRLIGCNVGSLSLPQKKCHNDAWMINFDQYVWKNPANDVVSYRSFLPDLGLMLFGRAGWAPDDRNVIDQFYSIGLGSYGGPNERYYDQWGIGYAGSHIAKPLRCMLAQKGVRFRDYEHALELFYNARLTPALHLTADAQIIRPPLASRRAAFIMTMRLQADF